MDHARVRVLLPSIVDPALHRGGAGAVTRAFVSLLRRPPLDASIVDVAAAGSSMTAHRARQLAAIARSLLSSLPSKAAFTYSRRFLRRVKRLVRERPFDLVVINGSDLLWLMNELPPAIPRVLLAHNIEHRLFRSQIDSLGIGAGPLRRAILRDWQRLQRYEITGLQRVENAIFLSSYDAEFALAHCPSMKPLILPPLFDYPPAERARPEPAGRCVEIGFLANFGWWPNREGLRWFLEKIFPHAGENIRLHLFGEQSHAAAPRHPRIVAHGFVPNIRDVWPACDFMVCPVFSGGGAKIKLAEALYNRVPVVATSFAARGLPLEPDPGIVLLDGAADWIEFLRSPAVETLGRRRLPPAVADAFMLDSHLERVQTFISEVIGARRLARGL